MTSDQGKRGEGSKKHKENRGKHRMANIRK